MPYLSELTSYESQLARIEGLPNGQHVDILILDLGDVVEDDYHFISSSGTSRVNYVDWYRHTDSPVWESNESYPVTQPNPFDGESRHATQCASVCADQAWGWSKESNIFSMNITQTYFGPRSNRVPYFAQMIKNWHEAKEVNPATGRRNPTVINMSFGQGIVDNASYPFLRNYDVDTMFHPPNGFPIPFVSGISYQGTFHKTTDMSVQSGVFEFLNSKSLNLRIDNGGYRADDEAASNTLENDSIHAVMMPIDMSGDQLITDYQDLVNTSGIICVAAAGNSTQRAVPSGHADYNNYISIAENNIFDNYPDPGIAVELQRRYYNRVTLPANASGILCVGAVGPDIKRTVASFSNRGPIVDIYAPGEDIKVYNGNGQSMAVNGTSFACPQVVGMIACYLSDNNYDKTSSEVFNWLDTNALPMMNPVYDDAKADNLISLQTGSSTFNKFAHYPDLDVYAPAKTTSLSPSWKPKIVFPDSGVYRDHRLFPKRAGIFGKVTYEGHAISTNITNMLDYSTASGDFYMGEHIVNLPSGTPDGHVEFFLADTDGDLLNNYRIQFNGRIHVEVNDMFSTNEAGAYLKYQDQDNYYAFRVRTDSDGSSATAEYSFIEKINGAEAILTERSYNHSITDDVHDVRFFIDYSSFNNRLTIRAGRGSSLSHFFGDTLTDPIPSGYLGFFSASSDGGSATRCAINTFDYPEINSRPF